MATLRNGVDNCLAFVFLNKDGTPATGKTVQFFVVDAVFVPDDGTKLGGVYDDDGALTEGGIYDATERVGTPGTYDGVFPFEASKELNVQGNRNYRVVPIIDGEFRGDDQIWRCEYA